jgi:hypothetical protein
MESIRKSTPFLLAILSLSLAVYQLFSVYTSSEFQNRGNEMVSKWEERIQVLREALPKDVTQVGYIDDAALTGDSSLLDVNEFQLMQYSVAPVAINSGINHKWVIGNFNNDENLEPWLDTQLGEYELEGFGFGLYLIHNVEN